MKNKTVIGWREWAALPELGIATIKCKVDTGAKTSALHAYRVEGFEHEGKQMVRFDIHPNQDDDVTTIECTAEVFDIRKVSDSGGHQEMRYVIQTPVVMGGESFLAEITLTNRDTMAFRMLLGRRAMENRFIVDPDASFLLGENIG